MATTGEKQALGYLLLLALLGAGVQAVGASRFDRAAATGGAGGDPRSAGDAGAAALARQRAAVDSARAAGPRGRTSRTSRRRRVGSDTLAAAARSREDPATRRPAALIDVNTATAEELERLPRIGPALAKRMVAWRERHGPFAGPEDLRHVRGIGRSTVLQLQPLVTFSGRHRPLLSEVPPSLAFPTIPADGTLHR